MRVVFIENAEYKQAEPSKSKKFVAGKEYDLSEDQAGRWIRRGKARLAGKVADVEAPKVETPKAEAKGK